MKTIVEAASNIPVYEECDVLIVGSGSAGHSAAIAAARAGCKRIVLMERYGYSGGDVTGGFVLLIPKMSWYNMTYVRGLQEEWFTRMKDIPGACIGPEPDEIGSTDKELLNAWGSLPACVTAKDPKRILRAVYFEPNQLKIEMDKMLLEERDRINVLYHSWGTKPIMDGNEIKGVYFESKEGRKAILAKVVIDATGDGDIFRQTGAPFVGLADSNMRSSATSLVWRIGNVKHDLYYEWKKNNPDSYTALRKNISKAAGGVFSIPCPQSPTDVYFVNNFHRNRDCSNIKDLTETEINTRINIREVLAYLKKVCPVAFRDSYLYDIAPQTGVRCSNRLVGEYVLSANDWATAAQHDDVIAWHTTTCPINDNGPVEIPYRTIVPQKIDNLLCPGRHISADDIAIDWCNLIPQCVATGQAAGVAAAVALKNGTNVRNVDIKEVQEILVDQDVPLPRNSRVDKAYTECFEGHERGLYTELAKTTTLDINAIGFYQHL